VGCETTFRRSLLGGLVCVCDRTDERPGPLDSRAVKITGRHGAYCRGRTLRANVASATCVTLCYCGLMPAALITADHLVISARIKASNSAGLLPTSSSPCPASRDFIARLCAIFATSACRRAMTARGVRAGAAMPYQP